MRTGGHVSALALTGDEAHGTPVMALAVDTMQPPDYAFGAKRHGPGEIQIWQADSNPV
jgi:hypothetical protein